MSATAATHSAPAGAGAEAAQLPLPGGQAGATLTLHPLLCAVMRGPRGWFERAPGRGAALKALGIGTPASELIDVPIVAFLLEHPVAGPVLVDTGFQRAVAAGPSRERSRNLGAVGKLMARNMRMDPEQTIAAQLRARGVEPGQLGLIAMTHLHFDHASALSDFPAASVLVTEPEWQAAHARYPFMHGYVPAQIDPRPSYRTLEFPPASTADPFAHALDVFGDGSLRLVFTPGHT
ncbi:MAG TPA: MBL fold metallo-hydrolase, partial [Solirubrobacteraceae bacterium]|nr:MBL fold metallo-hydrolase [Solirubrobacteraceae bacterium]